MEMNMKGQIETLEKEIVQRINENNKLVEEHEDRCKEYDHAANQLKNQVFDLQQAKGKLEDRLQQTEHKMSLDKAQYEDKIR